MLSFMGMGGGRGRRSIKHHQHHQHQHQPQQQQQQQQRALSSGITFGSVRRIGGRPSLFTSTTSDVINIDRDGNESENEDGNGNGSRDVGAVMSMSRVESKGKGKALMPALEHEAVKPSQSNGHYRTFSQSEAQAQAQSLSLSLSQAHSQPQQQSLSLPLSAESPALHLDFTHESLMQSFQSELQRFRQDSVSASSMDEVVNSPQSTVSLAYPVLFFVIIVFICISGRVFALLAYHHRC